MKLYTSSETKLPMRRKAGQDFVNSIDQPSLTLFGTAVPNYYYEALSEKMLNNGFFGRMLVFGSYKKSPYNYNPRSEIPDNIIDTARYWFEMGNGVFGQKFANPAQVSHNEGVEELIREFSDKVYKISLEYEEKRNNSALTVWGRAIENVMKLSLIKACSDDPVAPRIRPDDVSWSIKLVEFLIHNMMHSLELS